jgi:hypothetical protein
MSREQPIDREREGPAHHAASPAALGSPNGLIAASTGNGKGGLETKATILWVIVGIPLAWGVWKTLVSASRLSNPARRNGQSAQTRFIRWRHAHGGGAVPEGSGSDGQRNSAEGIVHSRDGDQPFQMMVVTNSR